MEKFVLKGVLVFLLIAFATTSAASHSPVEEGKLNLLADGLTSPMSMVQPNDSTDRTFVADQTGKIWIMRPTGHIIPQPYLDISGKMVDLNPDFSFRGLMDMALHPNFTENGKFYVFYSAPLRDGAPSGWDHTTVIAEFTQNDTDMYKADLDSERVILQVDQPQNNNNGDALAFGPDGYLYISLGDGGDLNNSQNLSTLLGSILRIDVDTGDPYGIPADNPFVGEEGKRDEICAYGFNHPFRMSFDSMGRLFVGDVGESLFEEVSIVELGGNYGWPIKEGRHCFDPENPESPPENCSSVGPYGQTLLDPVIEFQHPEEGFSAVIGGYVYEGDGLDGYEGYYIFGDFNKKLYYATPDHEGDNWTMQVLPMVDREDGNLSSYLHGFGEDSQGEIYALATENLGPTGHEGKIYKIVGTKPNLTVCDQVLMDDQVIIESFYLDIPGYVVIHNDADGAPGAVIGHSGLVSGYNEEFTVDIDTTGVNDTIWAMLHYDDGNGVYEFPGNDSPVIVNDNVLVKPINLMEAPAPAPSAEPEELDLELVADGLVSPVSMKQANDGSDRNFIVDQTGTVWIMEPSGKILSEPFLNITDRMVELNPSFDERGLLDIEFHPNYTENGKFYVYYSAPLRPEAPDGYDHTSHIAEYMVNESNPNVANHTSERILLQVDQPQFNHDAGQLLFGPDGYLYISLGDGGAANDQGLGHPPGGNGQNLSTLKGSILRIDVDTGDPYGIPADNPFVGEEGLDEIYAYGMRNPYRMSFDSMGRLFVSDAGQELFEEVSIVEKGKNYGWNIKEGRHCFDPENPNDPPATCPDVGPYGNPLIDPIIEYVQPENRSSTIVGGHVYEGDDLTGYDGTYFFADWNKRLFFATPDEGNWTIHKLPLKYMEDGTLDYYILGFGEDKDGEIYILSKANVGPTGHTGKIFKIRPKDSVDQKVIFEQEPDKLVYWTVPGQRRISTQVFGTPEHPLMGDDTLAIRMMQADMMPDPLGSNVKSLLQQLPILVALPEDMRETNAAGTKYTQTSVPVPFGPGLVTSGAMRFVVYDNQRWDNPGPPTDTVDKIELMATFTDPEGNEYMVDVKHVVQPPIPGYETGGGVVTNNFLHGITGTGSPLFPQVYTYAACWAIGDLYVNGELADTNKMVHVMSTQIARDKDYRLALDEELPLALENTIAGQTHHTHIFVFPIKATHDGPVFEPLNTSYVLPNNQTQPFIHLMWEQDTMVKAPTGMTSLSPEIIGAPPLPPQEPVNATFVINGSEYQFEPDNITVEEGTNVTILFRNVGSIAHNLFVGGYDVGTETIPPDSTDTVNFFADTPGEFFFYCTVPGHRDAGMEGNLTVVPLTTPTPSPEEPTAPDPVITSPSDGDTASGTVTICAEDQNETDITYTEFMYMPCGGTDWTVIGEDDTSPYCLQWDTTAVGDGCYMLMAEMYNTDGLEEESPEIEVEVNQTEMEMGIVLYRGWNLIPISCVPSKPAMEEVMDGIEFEAIGFFDACAQYGFTQNFSAFERGRAYAIYVNDSPSVPDTQTLDVECGGIVPSSLNFTLCKGFSSIASPRKNTVESASDIFTTIEMDGDYDFIYRYNNQMHKVDQIGYDCDTYPLASCPPGSPPMHVTNTEFTVDPQIAYVVHAVNDTVYWNLEW